MPATINMIPTKDIGDGILSCRLYYFFGGIKIKHISLPCRDAAFMVCGHVEDGETPENTALRETAEELQLEPEQIELIAPLHVLSGARGRGIHSFLGVLHDYKGTWEAAEVSRTFTVPLSWFRGNPPEIYTTRLLVSVGENFPYELIPGGRDYPFAAGQENVYFYRTPEGVIWGLTAKLLYHFLELLGGLNNAWRDYRRHRRFPL